MKKRYLILVFLIILLSGYHVSAHVPYLEHNDFSEQEPFIVRKTVIQSIAVYSWIDNKNEDPGADIDVYQFKVRIPNIRIYIELIGPVCDGYYENFVPWFALVGPGLSDPGQTLPFNIPSEATLPTLFKLSSFTRTYALTLESTSLILWLSALKISSAVISFLFILSRSSWAVSWFNFIQSPWVP